MRAIVLDTETTGLDPADGHRIVEIGCVELLNDIPSGEVFHRYLNPQRDVPDSAVSIHGLTADFLGDHPVFGDIVHDFIDFIAESTLVIHNAPFDLGFLNAELKSLGHPPLDDNNVIDTLRLAREKFPGAPNSLDALCRRFGIDLSVRTKHGALLDAELLSEVYLELTGGREPGLALSGKKSESQAPRTQARSEVRPARPHAPSEAEQAAHEKFLESIGDPIWRR